MAPSRDIVVVGAGVVGCAVAYELAGRGASVEIIDDRGVGMGATQASAGMLAPFNEAPESGPLLEIATRSLDLFDSFVARLSADVGTALTYHRTGTLDVALHALGVERQRHTQAVLSARGVVAEWLDANAIRDHEPALSPAALGGLLVPQQGFVGVNELTRALVVGARRRGAKIIEHGRVRRIASEHGEMSVMTDRGALSADAVVLAAGSWTGQIDIQGTDARVPVTPVRGQLLQLGWTGAPLTRVLWSDRCYVVPWPDGTVLVGATVEDVGFDERTTVTGVRELLSAVSELVPAAMAATFDGARAGLRPAAPDRLPILGRSSVLPQLFYATAHYRNGVLLAPLTAKLIAELVLENRSDPMLDVMSPERFGAF